MGNNIFTNSYKNPEENALYDEAYLDALCDIRQYSDLDDEQSEQLEKAIEELTDKVIGKQIWDTEVMLKW